MICERESFYCTVLFTAFHRPVLNSFVNMFNFFVVEGKPSTLIHTVNAAKPSFPTSIVGIVFTCFGWVGQGSPRKEGFKAYKFYKCGNHISKLGNRSEILWFLFQYGM